MKKNHLVGLTFLLVILLAFNHIVLADSWQQVQTTTTPEARQYHSLDYINVSGRGQASLIVVVGGGKVLENRTQMNSGF